MDSLSTENKRRTRSKTSKKDINAGDSKIPISNNAKSALKKKKKFRKAGGIMYIGHIPHGFYEDEMKSYFNQFGKVLATTVARSKKTGRSKGFGFVEFKDEEVAKIAAETMNNYLMFNRILKCRYIPPEEKKSRIIERKVSAYDFPKQRNRKINAEDKAKSFSNLTQKTYLEKTQAKIEEFKKFFEERGVDFSFELKSKGSSAVSERKNKTETTSQPESKDGTDNTLAVLEIDESEDEISFKTPPQVKKVIKKSLGSPATTIRQVKASKKSETGKRNLPTKKISEKTQKKGTVKKKPIKGVANISKKLGKKIKSKERSLKAKEFLVKDISTAAKGKKTINNGLPAEKIWKNTKKRSKIGGNNITVPLKNGIQISIKAEC